MFKNAWLINLSPVYLFTFYFKLKIKLCIDLKCIRIILDFVTYDFVGCEILDRKYCIKSVVVLSKKTGYKNI